ncbi:MAG: arginyltransferase [Deltaproteobacteria bacterium]|nr:arginyltransferase [Deltaproteobacteria bacterium]
MPNGEVRVSSERTPRVIPPPSTLVELGPLVVVDGDCAYFRDGRKSCTAFSLPGHLDGLEYQRAMDLGMRRSGTVVYRPLCSDCRKCQPLRIPTDAFQASKSQRRLMKKNEGFFDIEVTRPTLDDERLELYGRYQVAQHGEHAQSADEKSYRRFLIDTVTDTVELDWRNEDGILIGVGILDVTPDALSSVYFYWDPAYRKSSLGTYSALKELELCKEWGKNFYYLGYLVSGSKTMGYKADFPGAEVWNGQSWTPLGGRGCANENVLKVLNEAEQSAFSEDESHFNLQRARVLELPEGLED